MLREFYGVTAAERVAGGYVLSVEVHGKCKKDPQLEPRGNRWQIVATLYTIEYSRAHGYTHLTFTTETNCPPQFCGPILCLKLL